MQFFFYYYSSLFVNLKGIFKGEKWKKATHCDISHNRSYASILLLHSKPVVPIFYFVGRPRPGHNIELAVPILLILRSLADPWFRFISLFKMSRIEKSFFLIVEFFEWSKQEYSIFQTICSVLAFCIHKNGLTWQWMM